MLSVWLGMTYQEVSTAALIQSLRVHAALQRPRLEQGSANPGPSPARTLLAENLGHFGQHAVVDRRGV